MFLEMFALTSVNGLTGIPFGEAELEPGFTMKTCVEKLGDVYTGRVEHKGSKYMDQIFNNGNVITTDSEEDEGVMQYLKKGTKVDVTILHIPSNTIIYDKAVYVE